MLDVSIVFTVIAALGLGRLITLPISGPVSDRFGRRVSSLIGVGLYVLFFVGIIFAPNFYVAFVFALLGGVANSMAISAVMLLIIYFIETPAILLIGGFILGFAAAGVITRVGGVDGSKYVLLFNFAITAIGVLLAIYVNKRYKKENKGMVEAA